MITFLNGRLTSALPTQAIIDVGGVGYEVLIPLSSYDKLPAPGQPVHLLTHLHVREDAHVLYGFMTAAERDLFRLLVNHVSGIGPKLSLAVLSGMTVSNFKSAVVNADIASLSKISGLGKKTAERIVLELKDKLGVVAAWEAASAAMRRLRSKARPTKQCWRLSRSVTSRSMPTKSCENRKKRSAILKRPKNW
jgi:Holliday junction DNA helicase RuvA